MATGKVDTGKIGAHVDLAQVALSTGESGHCVFMTQVSGMYERCSSTGWDTGAEDQGLKRGSEQGRAHNRVRVLRVVPYLVLLSLHGDLIPLHTRT